MPHEIVFDTTPMAQVEAEGLAEALAGLPTVDVIDSSAKGGEPCTWHFTVGIDSDDEQALAPVTAWLVASAAVAAGTLRSKHVDALARMRWRDK